MAVPRVPLVAGAGDVDEVRYEGVVRGMMGVPVKVGMGVGGAHEEAVRVWLERTVRKARLAGEEGVERCVLEDGLVGWVV
jgi:hypothetical protein